MTIFNNPTPYQTQQPEQPQPDGSGGYTYQGKSYGAGTGPFATQFPVKKATKSTATPPQTPSNSQNPPTPPTPPTPTPTATTTPTGLAWNAAYAAFGVTQDSWNQMSATQQMLFQVAHSSQLSAYGQSATAQPVPTDTIRKLWTVSENDPLNPSGGTLLNGNYQGNTYSVIMVQGQEVPGGVFLPSRSPGDQLWLQYSPDRGATFSGLPWVSGQAYAAGAQVYYDPALNFYKAISAVTSTTSPDQDSANWQVATMPREVYPFVRDTAVANYLASMKNERYAFYQQRAEMFMLDRKMAMLRNPFSQPMQIVHTHATERRMSY